MCENFAEAYANYPGRCAAASERVGSKLLESCWGEKHIQCWNVETVETMGCHKAQWGNHAEIVFLTFGLPPNVGVNTKKKRFQTPRLCQVGKNHMSSHHINHLPMMFPSWSKHCFAFDEMPMFDPHRTQHLRRRCGEKIFVQLRKWWCESWDLIPTWGVYRNKGI